MTLGVAPWIEAIPWLLGSLAVLLAFHLLAVWMEDRGWINYRKPGRRGYGPAVSNAMAEFEAVLNPAAEHRIVEERHQVGMRVVVDGMEPLEEE
jgi:hypothetical protein